MSAFEEIGDRVYQAIGGAVAVTVLQFVSRFLMEFDTATASPGTFAEAKQSTLNALGTLPGLMNLCGIILSFVFAGPFGVAGYFLESMGASRLLSESPEGGIQLLFVGATIVVVGHFVWKFLLRMWWGRNRGY